MNYVFHKGQFLLKYNPAIDWRMSKGTLPSSSWVYNSEQGDWYYVDSATSSSHVPSHGVPKALRTMMLLLL